MKGIFIFMIILIHIQSDYVEREDDVDRVIDTDHVKEFEGVVEDTPESSRNRFIERWEKEMSDYEHEIIFTTKILKGTHHIYYEEVTNNNKESNIRGAFILDNSSSNKLELSMEVYNSENLLYSKTGQEEIFSFKTNETGILTIFLHNNTNEDLLVTFTINSSHEQIIEKEHLSFSEEKLENIHKFIKKFNLERDMLIANHFERTDEITDITSKYYLFSILETLLLGTVAILQFYFIRGYFEKKSSF